MKYWFDTEFIEDGVTIDLLSIGVVCEDGREFYAQNRDANLDAASEWVRDNVFPGMRDCPDERILHKEQLRSALYYFIEYGEGTPEFWAYYGDYDWVVLCQLFGTMMDLPEGWPMFAMDVKQLAVSLGSPELPPQDSAEHNALNDARWTRDAWKFLAVPVLETPAEAVFCDHSQWRECAATLEMVRDLSDKALNYTAAYDLANDLAAILAGSDDAIPGAPVEPVPTLNDSKDLTVELSDRPVPAPRLEWAHNDGDTHEAQTEDVVWEIGACKAGQIEWYSLDLMIRTESVGAALALAEKLNAVLSPPVGTQPKGD